MLLLEFTMTGTRHSAAYQQHKSRIAVNDELTLVPDLGNQFDLAAIKVMWEGEHIGWVPSRLGEAKAMLFRLIHHADALGLDLQYVVDSHEPENPTDMQLIVHVEAFGMEE